MFSVAVYSLKGPRFSQTLVNISAHTEIGNSSSIILLPLFFNSSSGVNIAKLIHKMHFGIIFTWKQHLCSYFSLHTYRSTKWLHCLPPDVLLPLLQLCEYADTCAHLLHLKYSYLGNHCESDQCVYEISDSELALELNLEVLTLTSVTPVFYWELLSVRYCLWPGEILVVWSVRDGENKWQLLDQIIFKLQN
jgi:hypothetical protein